VFNTAVSSGFVNGFILVTAISIIDGLYIGLSAVGISKILHKKSVQTCLNRFGSIVLIAFGANILLSSLGISIFPEILLFSHVTTKNLFLQGVLLTASNPLTIIFWSGVFATQVVENNFNRSQLVWFGTGCVLSTLCFLSFIAAIGSVANTFIPTNIILVMNLGVGFIVVGFGVRLLLKKAI
ncbi:MAG: LysE family transporter, partial [Oscillospiraceae bacterium]